MAVDHHALSGQLGQSVETTLRLGSVSYEELLQVRRVIEPPCAGLAAAHRDDEHISLLEAGLARQRSVTVADPEITDYDIEFHSVIAEAARNRLLAAFITALHRVARPVQYLDMTPAQGRKIVQQHASIIEAIKRQDVGRAESDMAAHIEFIMAIRTRPTDAALALHHDT
jgi:DNA-binding FadR family transcriptional regulator